MADTATLADIAREATEAFTTARRGDENIDTLKDGAPEWVRELVYAAHGEFLPDDWRYAAIRSACSAIADSDAETEDDADDLSHEYADGMVDVYNAARTAWLASNLTRPGYVDEAVEELGAAELDTTERIRLGQYAEAREVFGLVLRALTEELESREEEE